MVDVAVVGMLKIGMVKLIIKTINPQQGVLKNQKIQNLIIATHILLLHGTGCPTKKFTFLKPVYLRPLISLGKSSVLEMNL